MPMNKLKTISITIILLLTSITLISTTNIHASPSGNTLYVGGSGPGNYTSIQNAINDSSNGDTVYVYSGTYYENVKVNKTINLIGEDNTTTIIDANNNGSVVNISANYVNISGFTIQNSGSGWYDAGIFINASFCNISRNIIVDNEDGIHIRRDGNSTIIKSDNNTIYSNKITHNHLGIYLYRSCKNKIINNNLSKDSIGIGYNQIIT